MSLSVKRHGLIYGPVNSRRLGRSLGINLLGWNKKICTLNCKYCERGWTEIYYDLEKGDYPDVDEIISELEIILESLTQKPEYITFSGNGEPSLHPEFSLIVDKVISIRNKKSPCSKVAILSNSTTLDNDEVINSLEKLDEKIMKIDAGNEVTFKRFNSQMNNITLEQVINGLRKLKNPIIQTLFANGEDGNYKSDNIKDWIEILKSINPKNVQIYTLDRGYPSDKIYPLEVEELEYLQILLKDNNIKAEIYY